MEPWSLCFLVLVASSASRGQSQSMVAPTGGSTEDAEGVPAHTNSSGRPSSPNGTASSSPPDVSPGSPTPGNQTTPGPAPRGGEGEATTQGDAPSRNGTVGANVPAATAVATTTNVTSPTAGPPADRGSPTWAYVILVFIILVIIVLCIILFFLRRASRTYSFDLQRPAPPTNLSQATFEPVYLDDLDRTTAAAVSPPANGTGVQPEDKDAGEDNASKEQSEMNGLETPPPGDACPAPGEDPADLLTDLLVYPIGQEPAENPRPRVSFSDPFVEINLEEPPWSDQLLAAPAAPSSVLPFSSSSSSS